MLDRKKELQLTSSTVNAELLGPVIVSYCKTVVDLVPAVENIVSKITKDVCVWRGGMSLLISLMEKNSSNTQAQWGKSVYSRWSPSWVLMSNSTFKENCRCLTSYGSNTVYTRLEQR